MLLRGQPHVMDLAGPCEATTDDEVLGFDGRVIGQAEFPERDFKMRALGRLRIEVDRKEQEIAPVRCALAVIEDIVVPGVVERDVVEDLQSRRGSAQGSEAAYTFKL